MTGFHWDRMSFEITVTREFAAAHRLRLYDGSMESVHGHNWRVRVTVSGGLDSIGVVMDFHKLEHLVDEVTGPMRERLLNDLPVFAEVNPSAENVALHIGQSLKLPPRVKLLSVEVWEVPENSAVYRPGS